MSSARRLTVEVRADSPLWRKLGVDVEAVIRRALDQAACRYEGEADAEAAVLLTDDAAMQVLNRRWRNKDKPTDVLSFPSDKSAFSAGFLGDIAIGYETSLGDAARLGRPIEAHLSHLAVHGFLHLLGYDHVAESDAEAMEAAERDILAVLGYPDPYLTTTEETDDSHAR